MEEHEQNQRSISQDSQRSVSEDRLVSIATRDQDANQLESALAQLAGIDSANVLDALANPLSDPDVGVRRRAVRLIGRLRLPADTSSATLTHHLLNDPGWSVREAAAFSIADVWDGKDTDREQILNALTRAVLYDPQQLTRRAALDALRQIGVTSSDLRPVAEALKHARFRVRCRAIEALSEFPEVSASYMDCLTKCLSDSHLKVRQVALGALNCWGLNASEALPQIARSAFDQEPRVAAAARVALDQMADDIAEVWRPWYEILVDGDDPQRTLRRLQSTGLPAEVIDGFQAACWRRAKWNHQNRSCELVEADTGGIISPQAVADALADSHQENTSGREKLRRREYVWLLTKLLELLLASAPCDKR